MDKILQTYVSGGKKYSVSQYVSKFFIGTARSVICFTGKRVAASLLRACYLAVIKPISGCVRIAYFGLMMTSLLQVVNRLDAS